jgi:hypothetical protein
MNSLEPLLRLAFIGTAGYLVYEQLVPAPPTPPPVDPPKHAPYELPPPPHEDPPGTTIPNKPLGYGKGMCFGVTDQAFAPYSPNIKNPCPGQPWGWSLVPDPTSTQCKKFVGSDYLPAMGGCVKAGTGVLFLLVNNIIH